MLLDSLGAIVEDNLTYEDIAWVAQTSQLPVCVKGVLHPDDASMAVEAGAAGIVVSNHVGRQLEGVIPSLVALPAIARAVRKRVPVLLDSGVRSGEDVVRALALGANAVLLGRPVLWALAVGGEDKVVEVLAGLQNAIAKAMALCGVARVSEIGAHLVTTRRPSKM